MTRERALEFGLLTCKCGHPSNNHFEWGARPCAHCACTLFTERGKPGVDIVHEVHTAPATTGPELGEQRAATVSVGFFIRIEQKEDGRPAIHVCCERCGLTIFDTASKTYDLSKVGHWLMDHFYDCKRLPKAA